MPDPKPPSRLAGAPFSSVPLNADRSARWPAALSVSVPSAIRVIVALAGRGFVEHQWRGAAEKGEAAALDRLASATERAQGNYDAAEAMKLQVEADKRTIEMQGGEIERWKADSLAMKQTNDALIRKGRDDRDRSLAEIAAQEEKICALETPDTVHRLSPPVRALADSLSSE